MPQQLNTMINIIFIKKLRRALHRKINICTRSKFLPKAANFHSLYMNVSATRNYCVHLYVEYILPTKRIIDHWLIATIGNDER